jgi:phosphoglycerol transferase
MPLFKSFSAASLSVFPALISYFLVARAILDKNESDLRYAFGLLIIFAICWLASFSWMPERRRYTMAQKTLRLAALVVPAVFIFPMTVVVLIFGEVDMAAFVFHLVFGLAEGTPWDDMVPFLVTALVFWIVFCVSLWRTQVWLDKLPITWFLIAGAVFAINPLVYDLGRSRISSNFSPQKSLLEEYEAPKIIENSEYPNLIILYLEGLERSYLEHPSLSAHMSEMNALAAANPNLTQVHQIFGTGWSLAGNLSTQCGVPVLPFGARSLGEFSEIREIMPNVTCLGDVLADRGYDQSYASTTKIIGNRFIGTAVYAAWLPLTASIGFQFHGSNSSSLLIL